ncbi:hypothetical protein SAMN04488512_101169 [Sulfitobacter litoralis]|uniref:Uncharacterized protein n=1 Tax=Sulfitobacter litoralis TaxID=335975 RepID=A0ABY0RMD9_9RHOB|nr:hypothetical protein SAMN04488512_101169 [Sulfitobacter litoralis]
MVVLPRNCGANGLAVGAALRNQGNAKTAVMPARKRRCQSCARATPSMIAVRNRFSSVFCLLSV